MKQSHFGDVVEKVVSILPGRPCSDLVTEDLNKSNVYSNSYHVVSILKALVNPKTALGFFAWAKKQTGFRRNGFTYTKLFEILGEAKDFKTIEFLMEDIVKDQVSLIPNAFTAIARVYAYVGMLEASVTAFERMEKYDCIPNSHTFNIMIDALVKAGFPKQAYGMYDKMLQHVLLTNLYICNLLVYSF